MEAGRPEQRRAALIIAVAVAVLLVAGVGGYLGLRSAPDEGPQEDAGAHAAAVTTNQSQAPPSASASQPPTAEPSASAPASPSSSPSATPEETKKDPMPPGWKNRKVSKLGFQIGLPKGWKEWKRTGTGVEFKGPGGASNAHVRIEEFPKLGKDPLKGWKKLEPSLKDGYGGYKKISIKKADYRKAAADWDFIWPTNTGKSHIRYRGFIAEDGKAYAIYWHTLSSHWKADYDLFEGFCATFVPPK